MSTTDYYMAKTKKEQCALLLESVYAGDVDAVKDSIAKGAAVNYLVYGLCMVWGAKGNKGLESEIIQKYNNCFTMAADSEDGYRVVVGMSSINNIALDLSRSGAEVNIKPDSWSALMMAAARGYTEIVKELIKAGADVDFEWNNGVTSLMLAATNGHIEVVKELIKAGADVGHKFAGTNTILDLNIVDADIRKILEEAMEKQTAEEAAKLEVVVDKVPQCVVEQQPELLKPVGSEDTDS